MTQVKERFPMEPLIVAASVGTGRVRHPIGLARACPDCPDCVNEKTLAELCHVHVRSISRYVKMGSLPINVADVGAISLGRHPAEIWPTEYRGMS